MLLEVVEECRVKNEEIKLIWKKILKNKYERQVGFLCGDDEKILLQNVCGLHSGSNVEFMSPGFYIETRRGNDPQ